jgi:ribosomal protein S12 methylthiotransferase
MGQTMEIIIDHVERKLITGRSQYDAPEIDGLVYIKNLGQYPHIQVGDLVKVEIIASQDYDLYAKPIA